MTPPVHRATRRVRHSEVDAQGVVFNGHYLTWCDDSLDEYFEALGLDYGALLQAGYDVQVVNAEISWRSSYRAGQTATIDVVCERVGRTSYAIRFDMTEGDREVATGRLTYVVVRTDGSGKTEVPAAVRAVLLGEPAPGAAG